MVAGHLPHSLLELVGVKVLFAKLHGPAATNVILGVFRLVVVGGEWVGHQNRRQAEDGQFTEGGGAGPGNEKIRLAVYPGHIPEKGGNLCPHPGLAIEALTSSSSFSPV